MTDMSFVQPDPSQCVDAEHLRAMAQTYAESSDHRRRLDPAVAAALKASDFPRHFVPAIHGGLAGDFSSLMSELLQVATGCASTAWCATIFAVAGRMASYLPKVGQQDLWRAGPHTLISASFRPTGRARAATGGWRLSGEWRFLSGVDYADWVLLCFAPDDGPAMYGAAPVAEITLQDDWSTLGMRGTGSHSARLEDTFIPQCRSFLKQDLWAGTAREAEGRCYNASPVSSDPPLFVASALGAARAAIDLWSGGIRSAPPDGPVGLAYARSAAELDAAELLLERACGVSDLERATPLLRSRNGRDATLAADLILAATQRIFHMAGSQAHDAQGPALRHWRDIQTLSSHVALREDLNFGQYARQRWPQFTFAEDPRRV